MSVRAIKEYLVGSGYKNIKWGRNKSEYTHRLIAEYKLGRKLRKNEEINHIDRNKSNNSLENIEV